MKLHYNILHYTKYLKLSHAFYIFSIGMTVIGLLGLFTALYWIVERHIGG